MKASYNKFRELMIDRGIKNGQLRDGIGKICSDNQTLDEILG